MTPRLKRELSVQSHSHNKKILLFCSQTIWLRKSREKKNLFGITFRDVMLFQEREIFSLFRLTSSFVSWASEMMSGVKPRAAEYDINQCIWKLAKLFWEHILQMARTLDTTWNGKLYHAQDRLTANYQLFFFSSSQISFCYILHSNSRLEKETIFPDSDFFQYFISWCLVCF